MAILTRLLQFRSAAASDDDDSGLERKPAKARRPVSEREVERGMADAAPDTAFVRARNEFYESVGTPVVQRARLWTINIVLLGVIIAMALAIKAMLPLKTVQPWVVKVDDARGTVELDKGAATLAQAYSPSRPVLERELFEFVKALWSINGDYPTLTKETQESAYARTRDRAAQEFRDFVKREGIYGRMRSEPGLTRSVERKTITFRAEEGVAMARFATSERTRSKPDAVRREWLMMLQYKLVPQNAPNEIERNPLGLYVFHFEINEER